MDPVAELDRLFPGHRDAARDGAWEDLNRRLAVGAPVQGPVVARFSFGAVLDIGAGFPALLLVPEVAGLTPDAYRDGDWPAGPAAVAGRVMGFRERLRQIEVSQVRPFPGGSKLD